MAAVPVLRSVMRVRREVALLPRILIAPKRNVSGGKGAEPSGGSKTLVSFPVKQPHDWPSVADEKAAPPSTILQHLEVGRESSVDPGQKTARPEPRQEEDDDSSSSSSSSSDSDSDLEEDKKRKKDKPDPKWGSKDQKTQTGQPGTRELEIPGGEKAGEDSTHVPPVVRKQKPKQQNKLRVGKKATTGEPLEDVAPGVATNSGKKTPSGGQDLAGEVDVAPAVDTKVQKAPKSMKKAPKSTEKAPKSTEKAPKSTEKAPKSTEKAPKSTEKAPKSTEKAPKSTDKTPSGGQDLAGEDLVDVAPAVDTKVQKTPQSMEKTPSGDQDLVGEDLVDVAPAVDTKSMEKTPKSMEKTPSGGQDLAGEDFVDVAPTFGTEKPAHGESRVPEPAKEGRLASSQFQDVGETQSSGGNIKELSEEPSVSSLNRSAESDDPSPAASSTPPPPSAAPPPHSAAPPPPSAAPPPEEPFDNSKYQNQQHFSYTPFTFVDYDVDLATYRLPQPSSGRPSPFH